MGAQEYSEPCVLLCKCDAGFSELKRSVRGKKRGKLLYQKPRYIVCITVGILGGWVEKTGL